MKEIIPINVNKDGCAYAIKHTYSKNVAISTVTRGGGTSPAPQSRNSYVRILGTFSPTSAIGGRVIDSEGIAPTLMAGTHGYGFGCVLIEE